MGERHGAAIDEPGEAWCEVPVQLLKDIPEPWVRVAVRARRRTGKPVRVQLHAGEHGEREEPLSVPVGADAQPPAPGQPGDRALRLPPVAAQPLRGLHPTPGDADLDPSPGEVAAAAAVSEALSAWTFSGRRRRRPAWVRPGGRLSSSASNTRLSLLVAPGTSGDSGSPPLSTARWSLDPALARSTGLAPTWSPL